MLSRPRIEPRRANAPRGPVAPLLLSALVSALAGCGSAEVEPPPAQAAPIHALYGAPEATMLSPYPSNRYAVADAGTATGLRVQLGAQITTDPFVTAYPRVVEQLNEMDGFSTSGGVVVSFDGPIDIRGIVTDEEADPPVTDPVRDANDYTRPGSPFLLLDVDPASPERGMARGLVPRWWAQAKNEEYTTDDYTLVAQPATPLLPGTRYLFVVTSELKAKGGGEVLRTEASAALIEGDGEGAYGEEVRAALADLEASVGVPRDRVVLATVFTTASVLDATLALAERARAAAPPPLLTPWEIETPMEADGRVRFRAVFGAPEYRRALPNGKWEIGPDGAPISQGEAGLEVFLAFSDGTQSGPRPVVLYAHGLGGDKDGCWGTAERLAELNAAVISIDSPEHGSRASDPESSIGPTMGFFGVDLDTGEFDIGRARDNFRQMTSDHLELVRFLGTLGDLDLLPVGAPDGVPDLDVSRLLYIGHSFGSVQGPSIFALAPEIRAAVWNVGGDGLMMMLRDSSLFSLMVEGLKPPSTPDGALGRFFAMTQALVDPGDPLNYARFCALSEAPGVPGWVPRDMLLQEVIDDNIVPNSTSEALARAAGLLLIDPIRPISGLESADAPLTGNLPGGATGAIAQFDTMHGGEKAEHGELIFAPEARVQYVEFFRTALEGGHATVVPPYP